MDHLRTNTCGAIYAKQAAGCKSAAVAITAPALRTPAMKPANRAYPKILTKMKCANYCNSIVQAKKFKMPHLCNVLEIQ